MKKSLRNCAIGALALLATCASLPALAGNFYEQATAGLSNSHQTHGEDLAGSLTIGYDYGKVFRPEVSFVKTDGNGLKSEKIESVVWLDHKIYSNFVISAGFGVDYSWSNGYKSVPTSDANFGYVLGLGAEYKFNPNWSGVVEVKYEPSAMKVLNSHGAPTDYSGSLVATGMRYNF